MVDRVPSDDPAIETHRVALERVGRTDRPRVRLPTDADLGLTAGDVVRFALGGSQYHALVGTDLDGELVISHVGANARVARDREGPSELGEWVDRTDATLGGSVHLDVVTPGHEYGLRTPGSRVVYDRTGAPDSSLADIAKNVDS